MAKTYTEYQKQENKELGVVELVDHPEEMTYCNFITYNLSDQSWLHGKMSINIDQAIKFLESKREWCKNNNNGYLMIDNKINSSGKVYNTWTNYSRPKELTNEQHLKDRESGNDDMPF